MGELRALFYWPHVAGGRRLPDTATGIIFFFFYLFSLLGKKINETN